MREKAACMAVGLICGCMLWISEAFGFDVVTVANVQYIDEWDVGYTKIQLDQPTSCGGNWIWMSRQMDGYDLYIGRALAALMAGRAIRITERAPAYCNGASLYNARIGNM
jgi:hypothetical protein